MMVVFLIKKMIIVISIYPYIINNTIKELKRPQILYPKTYYSSIFTELLTQGNTYSLKMSHPIYEFQKQNTFSAYWIWFVFVHFSIAI